MDLLARNGEERINSEAEQGDRRKQIIGAEFWTKARKKFDLEDEKILALSHLYF